MAKYKNIPVKVETYELVKFLAQLNRRGLGAQVEVWAEEHRKHLKAEDDAVAVVETESILAVDAISKTANSDDLIAISG